MNSNSKIQILIGKDGIKTAYEHTLMAKSLDIICLSQNYSEVIGEYFDKDYAPRLFKSKITTREIISDNQSNRQDAKNKDRNKNQVGFLFKDIKSESDFIVGDDFVILISFNLISPFAILIEDQNTVTSMKSKFDVIWENALK